MKISTCKFDTYNGEDVMKITAVNDNGVGISCLTLGATWHSFTVPTAGGDTQNLLLSYDNVTDYLNGLCTCQSIGRVAGRIAHARCTINGKEVTLPANENGNTLHGGGHGFNTLNWNYTTTTRKNEASIIFQRTISSETDGFPGNMLATIIFTLNNNNQVTIAYSALNGKVDTLFNPTCHAYFNLSDHQDLETHELQINSSSYLDLDEHNLPTGRVREVAVTPRDFRTPTNIKEAIAKTPNQEGFDDAFVVNEPGRGNQPVAVLRDTESGRQITIDSGRNALIMYTMGGSQEGNRYPRDNGKPAVPGEGVALEAQTLPDAINQENFGDIVLPRGAKKTYRIRFSYDEGA